MFIGKAYRKAKIEKNPNITYYDVGSSVNLTCEAEKNTNLYEIIWYKRDSQGNMITLKSALNGPGILTLTLKPLSKENAGSYKCVISRPQVNYYHSRVVKITLKGKTSKLLRPVFAQHAYILLIKLIADNIQLLDEVEQNIVIYQWRADLLFADAEGRGK